MASSALVIDSLPPRTDGRNFDPTGAWRINDGDVPVDATGVLYDGTPLPMTGTLLVAGLACGGLSLLLRR